ncbi:MAG: response regulator [Alphaproteobacteria bacterium]|nr:response regulator [Alphaproteobacteria bacterium]
MKPMKILLADDHAIVRHLITHSIVELGLPSPHETADGAETLNRIQKAAQEERPYDLVFLDWNMDGLDGFEVLTACRANPKLANMAIVMLTAESEQHMVLKAIKAGATSYITKPFTAKRIQQTLIEMGAWKKDHPHDI